MKKLRFKLLISWLGMAIFLLMISVLGLRHPAILITAAVGVFLERTWLPDVYARAPTARDFFASALPKFAVLAYGFVLATLAIWLLTIGQRYGHGLEEYLPVIGAVILGPLLFALALHQIHTFRILGKEDV
jgi:hypothetical protein